MKTTIRRKFILGVVFFLIIILLISVLSSVFVNKLSDKTSKILLENHYSVVYARDMSENLTLINQEILNFYFTSQKPDSVQLNKELKAFGKSLDLEKNNITEPGEEKLALNIEKEFNDYRNDVIKLMRSPDLEFDELSFQHKFRNLFQLLNLLSQMNGNAIELKTGDAKIAAKNASIQMSIIAALAILIAFSFTYSFASYFNERFSQLYEGIKEIVSSNYGQRLYFEGNDEFYEISLIFNEMAEKLSEKEQRIDTTLQEEWEKTNIADNILELKILLSRLKNVEEQANELISKFQK